jgi:hypothetical protein
MLLRADPCFIISWDSLRVHPIDEDIDFWLLVKMLSTSLIAGLLTCISIYVFEPDDTFLGLFPGTA